MDKERDDDRYKEQYINFIHMAAHDLQSPVRKLEVFTDRLIAQLGPGENVEIEKYSRRMRSCIAEIQSLVGGFAVLATSLRETMHYSSCDTGLLIKSILAEYADLSKEKNKSVSIENMPVLQGDITQLRRLFKELLENAIRFKRPGISLKLDISGEKLSVAEKEYFNLPEHYYYYKIIFADNGIGLAIEDAGRIFEPLVRLQGKSAFPGNGLGLALVKKIVENHCGKVYAENNNPEGLRVVLLIPENQD